MANSLETRSPSGPQGDGVLRQLTERIQIAWADTQVFAETGRRTLASPETLGRRKMGFGVPVGDWMRGELRPWLEDLLLSSTALKQGYFEPKVLRQIVEAHLNERQDRSFELWALLWLELWHREFMN